MRKDIQLSNEQNTAVDEIFNFIYEFDIKKKPYWVFVGFAGTGKTTVISYIIDLFEEEKSLRDSADKDKEIAIATLTWKAANVLRQKGVKNAQSIHSLIYELVENKAKVNPEFRRIEKHKIQEKYKLIIIDEASMVNYTMLQDLLYYEVPILLVGDNFQLPPIQSKEERDKYGRHFLETPDNKLTQIHRTAMDNPIIEISARLRNGDKYIGYGNYKNKDKVFSVKKSDIQSRWLTAADQIIVGYNKTRKEINNQVRAIKKTNSSIYPQIGEKLIALNNLRPKGLFNGMQFLNQSNLSELKFRSKRIIPIKLKEDFLDDENSKIYEINTIFPDLEEEEIPLIRLSEDILYLSLGYAITTHKAQGSSWKKVLLFNQPIGDNELDRLRWMYTGVTRVEDKLVWVF
jgi:exodeoxyribonuclease-5